ncbi:MAG: hypothetical protein IPM21_10280 [Acidobacteria bacterium]|nr:hypothetical protein [Acidobacteriota bacterium]
MSESEFYTVLSIGIPIFIVFAIGSLMVLFVQAYQLAKLEENRVAKRATMGGLSFAVSIFVSIVISFFAGHMVAAILLVLWFVVAAFMPNLGLSELGIFAGLFLSAIPVIIIVVIIGIVLGIWPLTLMSIQGYKIAKQKQGLGAKLATVAFAVFGAVCCISSILTAAVITTSIVIELSGKRFGLT